MTFPVDAAARYGGGRAAAGGASMLRATVWTVGLFGAGTAICRAFPCTWTEPLVLFGLGIALLFVSPARAARDARPSTDAAPGRDRRAVASKPAAVAAPSRPRRAGGATEPA